MRILFINLLCIAVTAATGSEQAFASSNGLAAVTDDAKKPWVEVTPPVSAEEREKLLAAEHDHGGLQCEVLSIGIPDDEAPPAPRAGPLVINATFGTGVTAARQVVLQQAIGEWQAVVQESGSTPGNYPITFTFSSFGGGSTSLASTTTTYTIATGNLVSATMGFNTDYTWYVDATPADDSEFTGGSPPAGFDLLTVARHELGHALGWTGGPVRITNLTSGNTFDAPRLNIPLVTATGLHVDPDWLPNDLMVPTIGMSTRRPISLYPNGALVARAYEYLIPMRFVDPNFGGTSTGSANQPYQLVNHASTNTPALIPLLLSNDTHHAPVNHTFTVPRFFHAARGGAIIVAP